MVEQPTLFVEAMRRFADAVRAFYAKKPGARGWARSGRRARWFTSYCRSI
jgi:hypothetical protein